VKKKTGQYRAWRSLQAALPNDGVFDALQLMKYSMQNCMS
jgi:hypothetical protein